MMSNTQIDTTDYTISFDELAKLLGVHKIHLTRWLKECNITDWIKHTKNGKRWFTSETLEILRQAKKPPEGWITMKELEERLCISRDLMIYQVRKLDKTKARQYWRDMYLSPEAVIQLTIFFSQPKYVKKQYKARKDYNKIYTEQREQEWQEWEDEAVDESELVTFEGYTLTPEEHARRMEIRNKRDNYIPAIVVEHFKNWNVH